MSSTSTVTVWYLRNDGKANPSKVRITQDADMDDLRSAIGQHMRANGFAVDSSVLTLWKPKDELPIVDEQGNDADPQKAWDDRKANRRLDAIATKLPPSQVISSVLQLNTGKELVHVIVELPELQKRPADDEASEGRKRRKLESMGVENRLQSVLAGRQKVLDALRNLPAPSTAAKTDNFKHYMSQDQSWLKAGRPYGAVGPPVSIYHSVFAIFLELVANTDSIPDSDALDTARKLLEESSKFHPDEGTRQKKINDLLAKFLTHDIVSMRLSDSSSNDGMIRVHCQKIHVNAGPLFLEYKSEPDSVKAEPCMQAAFGYARYYLVEAEDLLEYCCCPSFTLAITGPSLQVSGVVIVDEMLVQDLMHPLCLKDAALPPQHFLRVARVLDALKVCTQQLHSFYEGLEKPLPQSARHLLPSFTSYTNAEGQDVRMEYLGRVRPKEESSRRALFVAETEGGKKEKVVVKFVHQYGERGHRLLAKEGLAPALHYFASLGGGTYVVVMEFVTGDTVFQANSKSLSPDVLADIERAVKLLHDNNLVFGDLRQPNIMVVKREDGKDGAMLIDFDWCGEDGEARYPLQLNKGLGWHGEVVCGGIIMKEHDLHMLSKIQRKF